MAIQYRNQTFDLTGTLATTVLTMDVSSRAILQNIQTENVSTATTTVVVSMSAATIALLTSSVVN